MNAGQPAVFEVRPRRGGRGRISTGSLLYRAAMSQALGSLQVLADDRPAETANVLSYQAFTELG